MVLAWKCISVIISSKTGTTAVYILVLPERGYLILVVLQHEQFVLVHLRDREDDQLGAFHLQLHLVDVRV